MEGPQASTPWQVDLVEAVIAIIALSIVVALLVLVYRTMQRPRLYLTPGPHGRPDLTWQAVLRYAITTPFMVVFWFFSILVILGWAAKGRTPEDLALIAVAVVGAARLLAHVDEEMSRELGKNIPLVVLGVILIGRDTATANQFVGVLDEFIDNVDDVDTFYWLLVLFDVLVTGVWYALAIGRWRVHESDAATTWLAHATGPITRGWRTIAGFGRGTSGPT